jgi:O-antigen/teichoic acid export membrane protein
MNVLDDLKKGAFVNFLGVIGKMAAPVFLVVVNRLYGPEVFGIFITANIAIEIVIAFLTSGFKDGAVIFVSRHAEKKEEWDELYTSLSNAFVWSIGFSVLVLLFSTIFGRQLLAYFYQDEFISGLRTMFSIMIFAIPLMAFEKIALASTQGLKIMKYDAISNGWLRPLSLLLFSVLFWYYDSSVTGMAWAYLATQSLLFLFSVWFYTIELSWKRLFGALSKFKINKELVDFAIPQSVNMTLNRFITGIDVLMLPIFGFGPAIVGFYGAGSMIVREIRNVKTIFSTAFAPYIVRLHAEDKFDELSKNFSKTAGWIATIAIPFILLVAIFKEDILAFIHPEYSGNSLFMFFLLPIPYLYCSFGLAGNVVAMTGYSKITLMNSIIVASINTALNFLLIPKLGLIGAAIASAIAMSILTSLELIEARMVANARLLVKDIFRPHLAGMLAAIILFGGIFYVPWIGNSLPAELTLTVSVIGIYTLLLGTKYIKRIKKKLEKAF